MANITVSNTIELPGGGSPLRATCLIELITEANVGGFLSGVEVLGQQSAAINGNGTWVETLTPNIGTGAITEPANTYYRITETADGSTSVYHIQVDGSGSSPKTVDQILYDPPGDLISTSALLATDNIWIGRQLFKSGPWLDVQAFGATGDGATNDATAIQATFNAIPANGGTVFFPAGDYIANTAITIPISGVRVLGAGRNATKIRAAAAATNNLFAPASGITKTTFEALTLSQPNTGGHIFAPVGGWNTGNFLDIQCIQNNPAKSILKMTDAGYLDNLWLGCILTHSGATSVPAFDFTVATIARYNSNTWQRCQVNNEAAGATWFFDFATSSASDFLYDMCFRDITAEITNGGFLRGLTVSGLLLDNVNVYDQTTTTKDLIYIGAGAGGLTSRDIMFRRVGRRGGTLGSGKVDIRLESGKAATVSFQNCNTASQSGFAIDLGTNAGCSIIGSPNLTLTNSPTSLTNVESHQARHGTGASDALAAGLQLDATARLRILDSSSTLVGARRNLRLIAGTGVALTLADDSGNERVDTTITSTSATAKSVVTAETSIANSASETALATYTVPGGSMAIGTTYRVTAHGKTDNIATSGTLTLRLRIGGVAGTVISTRIIATSAGANTGLAWFFDGQLTCRTTGASGTISGGGHWRHEMSAASTSNGVASITKDTTTGEDLVLTAQWATVDPGNICYLETAVFELVKV